MSDKTNLKISVEETGEVERSISIEIPRSMYNERFQGQLARTASKASIKGFRPGRAPRDIVAKLYGEQIRSEVINDLVSSAYREAIQENSLNVVGSPTIELGDIDHNGENDFQVTASVAVFPEPEVKDYFDLSFSIEVEEMQPDDLEKSLERMQQELEVSELSDEIVKEKGLAENVEELKTKINDSLENEVKRQNERAREQGLFKAIEEKNPFEVPQAMIDEEMRSMLFEMGFMDPNKRESYQFDMTEFRERLGETAEGRIRQALLLQKIIEKEDFSISDDDLSAWIDELTEKQEGATREQVEQMLGFPKQADALKDKLARTKMVELLLEKSKIKEKKKGKAKKKQDQVQDKGEG